MNIITPPLAVARVSTQAFNAAHKKWRASAGRFGLYSDPVLDGAHCYLTGDEQSGFAVDPNDGEFMGLFSGVPGRGDYLVALAIALGATWLTCYDGYLPKLYARHEIGRAHV